MKFFVSTGEISGDLHMSYLVEMARNRYPNAKFYGVGGKFCEEVGVEIIQNIDSLAVMGFIEALKKYSFLKKKAMEYLEFIKKNDIKRVILVDYGGFNLKFMELLRKNIKDIEIFYYIPPKLWVWGKNRIKKLKLADHIVVIFPWEVEFYKNLGVNAIYFGNPFVEKYELQTKKGDNILLLVGSRRQEITSILPTFIEIVKNSKDKKFLLKLSKKEQLPLVDEITKFSNVQVVVDKDLTWCVQNSYVAIAVSGTVTLELALLGLPTIVVYKTSKINAFIAKKILKIGLVSLPNLTLGRLVFPELLQNDCTPQNIIKTLNGLDYGKIQKELLEVRKVLGDKNNIIENYVDFIIKN